MTDENITKLPIKFKTPPSEDGPMLEIVRGGACDHRYRWVNGKMRNANFLIREGETEVECGLCGTRVDPMFVLRIMATEETTWQHSRKRYQDEMKRLEERKATKCEHCDRMTRISRR